MKKIFLSFLTLLCVAALQAQIAPYPQIPATFNYQGVARNAAGQPLVNATIKVISSIIIPENPTYGLIQFYRERRTVTTNAFGLFSLQVGASGADSVSGNFPNRSTFIAYGTQLSLRTAIVLPGTTAIIALGDSKLASVPTAMYAGAARPWDFTLSEQIPGSLNYTIFPDKDYWNLGLGTKEATEKLHVKGRIRMEDGTQAAGYVLTSDADGVGTWKPGVNAATAAWVKSGRRVFLSALTDSVGIGTSTPLAKLHVTGKMRLEDGTQGTDYNLVSDFNGLASWKRPTWTEYENNIGAGYRIIYATDTTRTVGIGTATPYSFGEVKLHVDGGVRFTGNGPLVENNVLTVDASGNGVWKSLTDNTSNFWGPGTLVGSGVNVIQTRPDLATRPHVSNSRFIINRTTLITNPVFLSSYPLQVQGGDNGAAIVINGDAQASKKFISFFDGGRGATAEPVPRYRGAIEGQTLLELQNDPDYTAYVALQTLSTGSFVAEGVACAFQVDIAEVAVMALQVGIWAADLGLTISSLESNVGVAYTSGAADYAEWLEKANRSEKFTYGDIVCVNGGKISKTLLGGGQLMVISKAPIVLGNIPDENRKADFEKVAFMGQVPVKVKGKVAVGDYIVAFANGSGLGYAVNPKNISTEEMNRIVGVAWSASGSGEFSMINTAVGLNTQAANLVIKKQEDEISLLKNSINQLSAYLQSKDASFQYTKLDTKPVAIQEKMPEVAMAEQKAAFTSPFSLGTPTTEYKSFSKLSPEDQMKRINTVSKERVKKLIEEQPQYLNAAMKAMKEKMEAQGQDVNKDPQMKRLFTDRSYLIENIRKVYGIM